MINTSHFYHFITIYIYLIYIPFWLRFALSPRLDHVAMIVQGLDHRPSVGRRARGALLGLQQLLALPRHDDTWRVSEDEIFLRGCWKANLLNFLIDVIGK